MVIDLTKELESSFLSCEKDAEIILRKLFIDHPEHSEILKKLLVINTKDCLDADSEVYKKELEKVSLKYLRENGYIRLEPKVMMPEHEEKKAYLIMSFDNFTPNASNPQFRDCTISFHIVCHTDCWDIGNYRVRPLKIAGYIDGLLNNSKLTGIGTLHFLGCNELMLTNDISGYTLTFAAIHGSDDRIEPED